MKHFYKLAVFLCLLGLSLSCDDSLLIVGGQDESGHLASMHLLTPSGWCSDINFPALPKPVINPGVHVFNLKDSDEQILIVCGFDGNLCKWTASGSDTWEDLPVLSSRPSSSFKIVALDDQNLVMVSTQEEDNFTGNTHTNPIKWFPYPWVPAEDDTAEFNLHGYMEHYGAFNKNMKGSCLAKTGQQLILSGGTTSYLPTYADEIPGDEIATVQLSEPSVARKSPAGLMWNMDIMPDLIQGRENHACLGTQLFGSEVVIVAGGNKYANMNGTDGHAWYFYGRETYETLDSVEVLQDNRWTSGPKLNTGRLGFGLGEICGDVMAMGGRQTDGESFFISHREGGVNGPAHWTTTGEDNIQETFLDSIETLKGISWTISGNKMPGPMANFGVAKAPLSLCRKPDNSGI
eukprot:TRINITY_DN15573_c0_g1_i2.p1 TRINITY_DN15573_c0_g1~~TRINITY_DN15573_c0_g1_i2.p1  ORF type:complete len:405 (+),score=57.40 TRINITY_DN15573_c0_g1_i2:12-1226(+)